MYYIMYIEIQIEGSCVSDWHRYNDEPTILYNALLVKLNKKTQSLPT